MTQSILSFERTPTGSKLKAIVALYLFWKVKNYVQRWTRPSNVDGKVILITGGGWGMGRNMALKLSMMGVRRLILLDINLEALTETKDLVMT